MRLHMVVELQTPGIKDAFVLSWKGSFLLKHYKRIINIPNQVSDFPVLWERPFLRCWQHLSAFIQESSESSPHNPVPRPALSPSSATFKTGLVLTAQGYLLFCFFSKMGCVLQMCFQSYINLEPLTRHSFQQHIPELENREMFWRRHPERLGR